MHKMTNNYPAPRSIVPSLRSPFLSLRFGDLLLLCLTGLFLTYTMNDWNLWHISLLHSHRISVFSLKVGPYIFHRTRTSNFTICMEIQKTSNSQSNLEKEEWNWRNQPAWLQTILQSHSHQDSMVLAQRQPLHASQDGCYPKVYKQ